jgi:hypothetical protein
MLFFLDIILVATFCDKIIPSVMQFSSVMCPIIGIVIVGGVFSIIVLLIVEATFSTHIKHGPPAVQWV